jgi:hypothetical protein
MVQKIQSGSSDEVRAAHQFESSEANRPDDSTKRSGESGQGDQVMAENHAATLGLN